MIHPCRIVRDGRKDMYISGWTEENDQQLADAVTYMKDDIADGDDFDYALAHHSALFGIERDTLRHEWNLRNNDLR